jgi:hexokinase
VTRPPAPPRAALPTGREKGRFWAIDMGGSNLRVVPVSMHGDGTMAIEDETHRKWEIPLTKMAAPGAELFDFLVEKMAAAGMKGGDEVGFTFSFPMEQTSIRSATLLYWTKGFTSPGVAGHDPVELLTDACKRAGLDVRVNALVNDTVGTLMAGAYRDPRTRIGVIMGTGTNACYSEAGRWMGGGGMACRVAAPRFTTCVRVQRSTRPASPSGRATRTA